MDYIRRQVWHSRDVEWFYAQNILLFVERSYLESNSLLLRESESTPSTPLSLVHPVKYLELVFEIRLANEIAELVPATDAFILVDDFGVEILPGRKGSPFLEHDGITGASPPTTMKRFANSKECGELDLRSSSSPGIRSGGWITTLGFINIFALNFNVSGRMIV